MEFVTTNTRQMHELLNDILTFSKVSGNDDFKFENVDLNELIAEIKNGLGILLHEKNGTIETTTLPVVLGPKVQLFLLFKNLIENGLKYNESPSAKIEISSSMSDGFFKFEVKDNGIGIDPRFHEQIFEMFKRLHSRDNYRGTGIGLATCKKIVSKYGGEIWIDSEEGQGCRVCFTFPIASGTVVNKGREYETLV